MSNADLADHVFRFGDDGRMYVHGFEVVLKERFKEEYRLGDDGAGSSPPQPTDRPSSRWVRLVGPWERKP